MNDLDNPVLSRLTNEIHFFNEQGIKVSIEVGKRLEEAKPEFINSDEWMNWANRQFGYKKSQAYKLVAIAKRFHSSGNSFEKQSINELYALTAFDDEELEIPVALPSGEVKKLIDMSQVEIDKYKQQLKEVERERIRLENLSICQQQELNKERSKPQQTVTKIVEVIPDQVKRELQQKDNQINNLNNSMDVMKKRLETTENLQKAYEKDSKEYKELKNQINFLNQEKNDLSRQIESATALSGLSVKIDYFLKTELAPLRYSRALERLDSEIAVRNLSDIIQSVENWVTDMRRYLPQENRIIVEVMDYDTAG